MKTDKQHKGEDVTEECVVEIRPGISGGVCALLIRHDGEKVERTLLIQNDGRSISGKCNIRMRWIQVNEFCVEERIEVTE